MQNKKARERTLMEGIAPYLWEPGWAQEYQEYEPEDLGEKDFLLDWVAINRSVGARRPLKTRQL